MGGLAKICKLYGSMTTKNSTGDTIIWLYDYKNDKPRIKSEMTKEEIAESEKAKFKMLKSGNNDIIK